MPTSDDFRNKALEFRRLAEQATEIDVKSAFLNLAETYERLADLPKVKLAPGRETGDGE